MTKLDIWFIDQILQIVEIEDELIKSADMDKELLLKAKRNGFSDEQIGQLRNIKGIDVRKIRKSFNINPVYSLVDTCAGEFEALTPYYYSCYASKTEIKKSNKDSVLVLGSGPNRIGQGIEFDYSCVHTVKALQEMGYEAIMVNSNPETVSTDYDTSDKLYFEPLTFEDVMNIYEAEEPIGIIVQMGGQTPLNLADKLLEAGVSILGTSPENIAKAEDRELFRQLLNNLNLKQPESSTAKSLDEAKTIAKRISFPIMIRPSFVLGGRAMMVAYEEEDLEPFVNAAFEASPNHPVLIDRFLENATEIDVDLLCDGENVYIGGVMEHIEEAGIHSGDSACSIPTFTLKDDIIKNIENACASIAIQLNVKGLMNAQIAVKDDDFYIIEVNPRASRTVPFVSKATNIPLANLATKIIMGKKIKDLGLLNYKPDIRWYSIKEAVFPFNRFAGVDPILGPEMKSTGEVMGIDKSFEIAFWKAEIAAGQVLPKTGNVFLSAKDRDKNWIGQIGKELNEMGFNLIATSGTAKVLEDNNLEVKMTNKLSEDGINVIDLMKNNEVNLLINTPSGPVARVDEVKIRSEAILRGLPIVTTCSGAKATIKAIKTINSSEWNVKALQDFHC